MRAHAASCYIGYHGKGMRDGAVVSDQDSGFYLKDVLDVVIEPEPQFFTEQSAAGGVPTSSPLPPIPRSPRSSYAARTMY